MTHAIIIIIIIIVLFRMKQHNIIIQMSIKNINKRHVKIHMKLIYNNYTMSASDVANVSQIFSFKTLVEVVNETMPY